MIKSNFNSATEEVFGLNLLIFDTIAKQVFYQLGYGASLGVDIRLNHCRLIYF